jgi:hypothetical protein
VWVAALTALFGKTKFWSKIMISMNFHGFHHFP